MRDFNTLQSMVARGEFIRDDTPMCERMVLLALRDTLVRYKAGNITQTQATDEKTAIRKAYAQMQSRALELTEGFRLQLKDGLQRGGDTEELLKLACMALALYANDPDLTYSGVEQLRFGGTNGN